MGIFTNESKRYFENVMEADPHMEQPPDCLSGGEHPNLDLICNARTDSVIYDLAPQPTGRRGRPARHGERLLREKPFLLKDGRLDYAYYLKGDTYGGRTENGKIQTVPLYLAD